MGPMFESYGRQRSVDQTAAQVMMRQNRGCIINMSLQAVFAAVYRMTKAAFSHLAKCLAVEWGKDSIHVNAMAPAASRLNGHTLLMDGGWRAR